VVRFRPKCIYGIVLSFRIGDIMERQDENKKDSGQQSDMKNYVIVALATALIVLGLVWIRDSGASGAPQPNAAAALGDSGDAPRAPPAPSVPLDMKTLVDDDPFLGDENAPVVMIEWSDYECPFCARFYTQTLSQIKSQYIDTGKVKFVYRDYPLGFHQQAEPAALAANCAGEQGKYFEYHDKIFEVGGAAGKTSVDYMKWAQELKLDTAKWEKCLTDPAQRQEIQKDMADGQAAGVSGTPGFVINGKLVSGAQPFSVFQQIIEAELS